MAVLGPWASGRAEARLSLTQLADVAINSEGELEIDVGGRERVGGEGPESWRRREEKGSERQTPREETKPHFRARPSGGCSHPETFAEAG